MSSALNSQLAEIENLIGNLTLPSDGDVGDDKLIFLAQSKGGVQSIAGMQQKFQLTDFELKGFNLGFFESSNSTALVCSKGAVIFVGGADDRKAFWLSDFLIVKVLGLMISGAIFSKSEIRLAKQLISNYSLVDAARQDGVSHETKRTHYKNLSNKLQIHSQTELVGRFYTHLLNNQSEKSSEEDVSQDANETRQIYPLARHLQLMDKEGRLHRYLDYGPVTGKPILLFPPQALLPLGHLVVEQLKELNYRLIILRRPGSVCEKPKELTSKAYQSYCCSSAATAVPFFADGPVPVIGTVTGAYYAFDFARNHPELVESVFAFGYGPPNSYKPSGSSRFRNAIVSFFKFNQYVTDALFSQLARKLSDPNTARKFFLKLYDSSPDDQDVLQKEFALPVEKQIFTRVFVASKHSVVEDFKLLSTFKEESLSGIRCPVILTSGASDPLLSTKRVKQLAKKCGYDFDVLENCGQLAVNDRFNDLLRSQNKWMKVVRS